MRFLEETGVDTAYAGRLLREYGTDVIDILVNDPYRVAEEIPRIGFRIADAVVRHADTPVDEKDRAKACMLHLFEQAVDQGHAYIAQDQLFDQCRQTFDVEPETGAIALNHLVQTGELVVADQAQTTDSPLVFPRLLHQAETVIARRIAAMQAIPLADTPPDTRLITEEVLDKLSITLSSQQEEILSQILSHKVSVVTGGPGTGKTTLIRSITAVMERLGHRVMLAGDAHHVFDGEVFRSERRTCAIHLDAGWSGRRSGIVFCPALPKTGRTIVTRGSGSNQVPRHLTQRRVPLYGAPQPFPNQHPGRRRGYRRRGGPGRRRRPRGRGHRASDLLEEDREPRETHVAPAVLLGEGDTQQVRLRERAPGLAIDALLAGLDLPESILGDVIREDLVGEFAERLLVFAVREIQSGSPSPCSGACRGPPWR